MRREKGEGRGTHVSSQSLSRKHVFLVSAKPVVVPERNAGHAEDSVAGLESCY